VLEGYLTCFTIICLSGMKSQAFSSDGAVPPDDGKADGIAG
jgi:hypothetical protein